MPKPTNQKPSDDIDAALKSLENAGDTTNVDLDDLGSDIDEIGQSSPLDGIGDGMSSEDSAKAELSETLRLFQNQRAAERKLFENTTDSEYWFCVCFQTREQKDAFLAAVGWATHGDKYLDGVKIAKACGVNLPTGEVRFVPEETSKRLVREIGTIENPKDSSR